MKETLKLDAVIIGGGIAGLWVLNRLRNDGYNVWLFEQDQLGSGQTIASQGMIHGGMKYALGGNLTKASNTIAEMPAHWKRCLAGEGDVDLRGCNLLSRDYYMWPRESIRSRLNAFLGSKALEAKIDAIDKDSYPAFFKDNISGPLYRLQDIVLDVPSLLHTLGKNQQDCIFRIDWNHSRLETNNDGSIQALNISPELEIQAQKFIFCCGAGAGKIMKENNFNFSQLQRRPLQMVMVKHGITDPVYAHCVSDKLTMTPELTITSHHNSAGEPVWYLGGELAEKGAQQTDTELIKCAREQLQTLFPWCDFSNSQWATLAIDRAEEKQKDRYRPDNASIASQHNIMLCWPTKLTLAPNLGNQVLELFHEEKLIPADPVRISPPAFFKRPEIAATPWEKL